ncbi:hypothetical protein SEVIR_8G190800v4 [Setaria viridis]|uniref:Uncharacterized protein n=1 Tax=Setaria viridis TaxID=4556 RepID=A0A4U6TK65_SETVI|nr:hypothetical protein SEVIR_8G190800v2 [Setaria viridis]
MSQLLRICTILPCTPCQPSNVPFLLQYCIQILAILSGSLPISTLAPYLKVVLISLANAPEEHNKPAVAFGMPAPSSIRCLAGPASPRTRRGLGAAGVRHDRRSVRAQTRGKCRDDLCRTSGQMELREHMAMCGDLLGARF